MKVIMSLLGIAVIFGFMYLLSSDKKIYQDSLV